MSDLLSTRSEQGGMVVSRRCTLVQTDDYQLRETIVEETKQYVSYNCWPFLQPVSITKTTKTTTQKRTRTRSKPYAQLVKERFLKFFSRLNSSRRSVSTPNKDDGAVATSLHGSKEPKRWCPLRRSNTECRRRGQRNGLFRIPKPQEH